MSEQEREMDLRFSVVVPTESSGQGGGEEEKESEARRIKEEWLSRNSEDRAVGNGGSGHEHVEGEGLTDAGDAVVVDVREVDVEAEVTNAEAGVEGSERQETQDIHPVPHSDAKDGEIKRIRAVSSISPNAQTDETEDERHRPHRREDTDENASARHLHLDPHDIPLPESSARSTATTTFATSPAHPGTDAQEISSRWLASSAPSPDATEAEKHDDDHQATSVDSHSHSHPQAEADRHSIPQTTAPPPLCTQPETSPTDTPADASPIPAISEPPTPNEIPPGNGTDINSTSAGSDSHLLEPDFDPVETPAAMSSLPTLSVSPPSLSFTTERGRSPTIITPSASVSSTSAAAAGAVPALSPTRSASSCTTSSEPPCTPVTSSDPRRARSGSGASRESEPCVGVDIAGDGQARVGLGLTASESEGEKDDVIVESPVEDDKRFDFSGVTAAAGAGRPLNAVLEEEAEPEETAVVGGQAERKKAGLFGRRGGTTTVRFNSSDNILKPLKSRFFFWLAAYHRNPHRQPAPRARLVTSVGLSPARSRASWGCCVPSRRR